MTTTRHTSRILRRIVAAGCAALLATGLSSCTKDDPSPASETSDAATSGDREDGIAPITDASELPTVDTARLDRTDPTSVSYHWLEIAHTFQPGDTAVDNDAYTRGESLTTEQFHKANESFEGSPFTGPWYLRGESLEDPVVSVNATATRMSPIDSFHQYPGTQTREWTLLERAITRSGHELTYRSNRVVVTMVPDGDKWLVDRIAPAGD